MKKIFTILGVSATMLMSAQNLIQNPGFENWTDGKPDAWLTLPTAYAQSTNPVHGGNYAASVTSATSTQTLGATDFAVTPGTTYVFTGWYLDNVSNARMRYWGQWRNASGAMTTETSMQLGEYSTNSPEWKQFSIEAPAPAGSTLMRASVRVYNEDTNTGGQIYFDDIAFYVKGTMAVTDVKNFDKQVSFNTLVKDQITFKLPGKATVNVYSMDGKLVSSNRVDNGGSVSAQSWVKGTYIVTVDNGSAKVNRKVVKQ